MQGSIDVYIILKKVIIRLMKQPYIWDNYSDQPYPLKDKSYKKEMRKNHLISLFKTFFISLFILPFSLVMMPFVRRKSVDSNDFFCIGVDYQRESEATLELIEELGVERVLVRFKLWEMNTIDQLGEFLLSLKDKKITLKIMQDREHIEDPELLREDLQSIFSMLNQYVDIFEIGTTINRTKWGFFSVDEYNRFYKVAYDLKISKFPHIKLIGSGVIDFEYHFTAHTLFNFYDYKYDGVSSLLYVDRRGAPENMQAGFTLLDKIALLSSMVWLSPKSLHELHITETNWPILGTAPFAPTSEYECVGEELYGDYMLRYYLLAFASQQVNSVSWHQLIAPGYGLIDNREGFRKREAYKIYKYMVATLKNAEFLRLDIKRGHFILQCLINEDLLQIHWSLQPKSIKNEDNFITFSSSGKKIEDEFLNIGSSPLYIFIK
jgi:hypothetical protein